MFEQQKKEASRGGMWLVRGRVERRGEGGKDQMTQGWEALVRNDCGYIWDITGRVEAGE